MPMWWAEIFTDGHGPLLGTSQDVPCCAQLLVDAVSHCFSTRSGVLETHLLCLEPDASGTLHGQGSRTRGGLAWPTEKSAIPVPPQVPSPHCSSPRSSCSPPGQLPTWWRVLFTGSLTSLWAWSSHSSK